MTVDGKPKGDLKGKHFKLHIRQLPKTIVIDSSYHEVIFSLVFAFSLCGGTISTCTVYRDNFLFFHNYLPYIMKIYSALKYHNKLI